MRRMIISRQDSQRASKERGMRDNAIVVVNSSAIMPAIDLEQAKQTYQAMANFVKSIMRENVDFGVIPGTGKDGQKPKPSLLKPGAEKLTRFFGLAAHFEPTKEIVEFHADEPFFYYRFRCILTRISDGAFIADGEGSCNSHEKKYRWRNADRACPNCGQPNIRKSKDNKGYYCWQKTGGCGATFKLGDTDIEDQQVGQVANPDIADTDNTILKQAQKRAFIAATLIACNASEYFTQDIEDLDYGVQVVTVKPDVDATTGELQDMTQTVIVPSVWTNEAVSTPIESIITASSSFAEKDVETVDRHWTETQNWKKFWTFVKTNLRLTEEEAHEALEVSSVKEFKGSKLEAMGMLEEYANEKAAAMHTTVPEESTVGELHEEMEADKQSTLDAYFAPDNGQNAIDAIRGA